MVNILLLTNIPSAFSFHAQGRILLLGPLEVSCSQMTCFGQYMYVKMTSVTSTLKGLRVGGKFCLLSLPPATRSKEVESSRWCFYKMVGSLSCSTENRCPKESSRPAEDCILSEKSCCTKLLKFRGCLVISVSLAYPNW